MILRKIVKIVASRCQILWLKCNKFDFGWGSAQTPLGELTTLPQTIAGLTSKRRGREGEGRGGEGKRGEGRGKEGRGRKGRGQREKEERGRGRWEGLPTPFLKS